MKTYKLLLIITLHCIFCCAAIASNDLPNILVVMGDDISYSSFGAYGCGYIQTPNFDKIAEQGVLFTNAYANNPKCAPARACFLTGRYTWQLEEAANHWPIMPPKWKFYPELLEKAGYQIGYTGKGWGPGQYYGEHNPAGWFYNDAKCKPPYNGINNSDYVKNFEIFLDENTEQKPFCFWLGIKEAHRKFEKDSYKKAGKDLSEVTIQKSMPDNDVIRGDLADYGLEVEYYDTQLGKSIALLEQKGLLDNTIIIVTADQGMAFPHIKGQVYDEACKVLFAVYWKDNIKGGRIITDFIQFPDVAPTIMELAGLKPHAQMTGKSFVNILKSKKTGRVDKKRSYTLLGKERHDIGRVEGKLINLGYPARAIRTDEYLYIKNFKPERWPVGNPEYGYKNMDDGPSKEYILSLGEDSNYYKLSFGKRPAEELYDMSKDPDCVINLAYKPEFETIKKQLEEEMTEKLTAQGDPRILGKGDIFDDYPHGKGDMLREFYGDKYYDMHQKFVDKYGNEVKTIPLPENYKVKRQ